MMRLFLFFGALFATIAVSTHAADPAKLLTIISTADEEIQMMALILTNQAVQQDAEVTVLLCGEAGHLATAEGDSKTFAPIDRSPRDMVQALLTQGVTVQVCALFLPNRELTEEDLNEGITTARPPEITSLILNPHTRILSF